MMPIEIFIALICISGAAGGLAGHLVAPVVESEESRLMPLGRRMLLGIIVAFTVPLFLSLAQSALVEKILQVDPSNKSLALKEAFIFAGFCIAASFSSRAFMEGLSGKVLAELAETKKTASKAISKAEKNEENIELIDDSIGKANNLAAFAGSALARSEEIIISDAHSAEDFARNVLRAVSFGTMRTASGIAKDAKLSRNHISEILDDLVGKKWIEIAISPNTGGRRYRITEIGAKILNEQTEK